MSSALRPPVAALLPVLALLCTACGDAGEADGGETLPSWSIEEDLRIGSMEGPDALSPATALEVSADGRLLVLQARVGNVRVYGSDGTLRDSVGRAGQGPGELQRPTGLGFLGDTLWVADPGNRRVTYYGPGGDHLRDHPYPAPEGLGDGEEARFTGVLADGSVLARTAPRFRSDLEGTGHPFPVLSLPPVPQPPGPWDTLAFAHMDHGRAVFVLGSSDGASAVRSVMIFTQPFTDQALLDLAPTGDRIALVERPVHGSPDAATFRVTAVGQDGDTLFSTPRRQRARPVPVTMVDSIVGTYAERGVDEDEARQTLFTPPHLPAASAVVAGRDGTVWVALAKVPGEATTWEVFGPDGAPLATLSTPPGFVLHAAEQGALWGVHTDELDVPSLVRYRVLPGAVP